MGDEVYILGHDSHQNLGFDYTSNYRVLNTAPGRIQLFYTLRELAAINFENTFIESSLRLIFDAFVQSDEET